MIFKNFDKYRKCERSFKGSEDFFKTWLISSCNPSRRKRRNSWLSCCLFEWNHNVAYYTSNCGPLEKVFAFESVTSSLIPSQSTSGTFNLRFGIVFGSFTTEKSTKNERRRSHNYCNYILFPKLPWPGDSERTFRSSSEAATSPVPTHLPQTVELSQ